MVVNMIRILWLLLSIVCGASHASLLLSSPTGAGSLDSSIPDFGGAVIDIVWDTGERFSTFLGTDDLLKESVVTDVNTGLASADIGSYFFGSDFFNSAFINGINKLAIRLSLYDGDNATMDGVDSIDGEFQANENLLMVNGANLGNFSTVETVTFTREEQEIIDTPEGMTGFLGGYTSIGWFYTDNSSLLDTVYQGIVNTGVLQMNVDIDKATLGKVENLEQSNFLSFAEPNRRPTPEPPVSVNEPPSLIIFLSLIVGWVMLVSRRML